MALPLAALLAYWAWWRWNLSDMAHTHETATALGGSVATVSGGLWATIASPPQSAAGIAGLVFAFAGACTSMVPLVRIWADVRKADRDAKNERHDLAGKLQIATLEIEAGRVEREELRRTLELYRGWMSRFADHVPGAPPVPPAPSPHVMVEPIPPTEGPK
jgi:hypothetical protein